MEAAEKWNPMKFAKAHIDWASGRRAARGTVKDRTLSTLVDPSFAVAPAQHGSDRAGLILSAQTS
jgi:hypothetical protein